MSDDIETASGERERAYQASLTEEQLPWKDVPAEFDLDVSITAQDIADGVAASATKCPAALAVRRALTEKFGLNWPHVNVGHAGVVGAGSGYAPSWYSMTSAADRPLGAFIRAYDRREAVEPISFSLHFVRESYSVPPEWSDSETGKTAAEIEAGDPGPDPDVKE